MNKQTAVTFAFITLVIAFATAIHIRNQQIHMFPSDHGNTAGNLHNYGLVYEMDGKVYFSNPNDNNCLYSMNRANVQKVNTAILYFHKEAEFSIDVVKDKWKELPSWIAQNERITDKTVYLKRVMCVVNGDSGYKVYEIKNPE